MQMKKTLVAFAFLAFLTVGCALTGHQVGHFSLVSQGLVETSQNVLITNPKLDGGTKTGRACAKNILGIFATGDMSIEAAKKAGNITTITSVTKEISNMIVMSDVCTVVKGY